MRPQAPRWVACALGAAFVLGACTPSAEGCAEPARALVEELQSYVDGYADVAPEALARGEAVRAAGPVPEAIARYRQTARTSRCDPPIMREQLADALATLRGDGVVAETIASSLRTNLAAAFADAAPEPETRRVGTGDDLAAAIAGSLPGSTIALDAGEHRVDLPIIVFHPITITGSGIDRTRIVTRAPGVALIVLGEGPFTFTDLSVERDGDEPASIVVIPDASFRISGVRLSGATAGGEGVGGGALVAGAIGSDDVTNDEQPMRTIEDSEFVENATAGILIGGTAAPTIANVDVRGNEGCGVCFLDRAAGVLRDSRVRRNRVGVAVFARAQPVVRRTTIARNDIGMQIEGRARPTIIRNVFASNSESALVFDARGGGRTEHNRCDGEALGIALLGMAAPALRANDCPVFDLRSRSTGVSPAQTGSPSR